MFVGRIKQAAALPGFQEEQARSGVRLNGFYLFMAHQTGVPAAARKAAPALWRDPRNAVRCEADRGARILRRALMPRPSPLLAPVAADEARLDLTPAQHQ